MKVFFFFALVLAPVLFGGPIAVGPGPSVLEIDDTSGALGNEGLTLGGPSTARGYGGLSALADIAVNVSLSGLTRTTPWTYDGVSSWSALFSGGSLLVTELANPTETVLDAALGMSVIDIIPSTTNGALLSITSGTPNGGYAASAFTDAMFVSVLMASVGGPLSVEDCQVLERAILGKTNIGGTGPGNETSVPEPWQGGLVLLSIGGMWLYRRRLSNATSA